jgi:prepilin-type N-terminal cleavage/methylation domain-containing protein
VSRRAGFTLVEMLISAVVLALLLLGGVVTARSSTGLAQDSLRTSEAERRARSAHDAVQRYVAMAGRSTLEAVPAGGGLPQPMQDGVPYDRLIFRRTVSSGPAGPVYDPAPPALPMALALQPHGPAGESELVRLEGGAVIPLCGGIESLSFVRTGSRITVTIVVVDRAAGRRPCTLARSLVLRNP